MSASKHTPGPWVFNWNDRTDQEGDVYWIRPVSEMLQSLAVVRAGSEDNDLPAQTEANACLIASAPDLLEALKSVTTWWDKEARGDDQVEDEEVLLAASKARAAIAKAEGRAA